MQMNGIAHVAINVCKFDECKEFYRKLFAFLEMQLVYDDVNIIYGVGSRTGIVVHRVPEQYQKDVFQQNRAGLHHFCFRARSKEDIDALYEFLITLKTRIIRQPEAGHWAPGYYSVLFEDPDGIRIEANYVPGKGNLDPAVELPRKVISRWSSQ